ncbi:mitogen-activated protein kinase kinase kinase kinase 3-like isoform X2 [Hydractinia symbiolongicarpus]|uniref:mitogen-activated protein kinase kinase kinase kinase 3-like isoform X2 n=1 Tax=Hydractinia symbiolongicarpus TaxID=13093 RepID=UPI00254D0041|nr:mitogen-activated protein kinase kinase kinase kinase 3-like isoform X2 [Hydractinia symbiolongicarpus]
MVTLLLFYFLFYLRGKTNVRSTTPMAAPRSTKANIQKTKPEKDLELIQRIGSGTYGEVYKARIKATGDLAAVKIINVEPGDDFDVIQQEICIMQDCKHANIVQYFGSYLRRDKLWIAMEFCGGGSLQDIYHVTGPLTEAMIGCICTEMLKGLEYMHNQNKIHRDIKGANILLTTEGDVKLADFGVGAQITSTIGKRSSFIGTPYWMAPEVAAVERTGGYDQMCDVWAVGITAIELAEMKPPLFDLHPMRALYLISKKNYTPPVLKDKNKWSTSMKDFVKLSLTKNPKKRPPADKLLQHPFCQNRTVRNTLSELLDKFEGLKQKKKYRYKEVDDSGEEEHEEKKGGEEKESTVKRIKSKKEKNKKEKLNLPDKNSQPIKKETEPERKVTLPHEKEKGNSTFYAKELDEPEEVSTIKEAPKKQLRPAPPIPKTEPVADQQLSTLKKESAPTKKESPPPPPPKKPLHRPAASTPSNGAQPQAPPPLPPRVPTENKRANCFSKIFNECPLNAFCATSWTHPETKNHHLLFASDEGIYSLNLDDLQNIEMFQIFSRPCKWVYVIKNILVSICGSPSFVYMHNLVSLHGQQNIDQFIPLPKGVAYTTKVPGTSNAQKCCVVHNPYNNQMYLFVGRREAVLLLQWYEPMQKFMIVRDFDCKLPPTLTIFEPIVVKGREYPILCVGAYHLPNGDILIDKLDLESGSNWEPRTDCTPIDVKTFSQLEKDVVMIAFDRRVIFTDIDGKKLRVRNRLTELNFDYDLTSAVCLPGTVMTFNTNGIQGKSLVDSSVTAQFTDSARQYKLLGSDRIVVIESKVQTENYSNLYILASG